MLQRHEVSQKDLSSREEKEGFQTEGRLSGRKKSAAKGWRWKTAVSVLGSEQKVVWLEHGV